MAVEQNRRAPVLDLSRPTAVAVEIDVAEAAEVLMSICAVADHRDHDTLDIGAEWLDARLETVPQDLLDAVDEQTFGPMKVAAHLLGIVLETPKPRTFAAFLERLEATDPVDVKLQLFGCSGGSFSHLAELDVIERAVRGDAEAQQLFLESLAEYSDKRDLVHSLLELGADEVKARLLNLLPRWYEHVFEPNAQEWREAAERDATAKRALATKHAPEQLVELAKTVRFRPAPGIRKLAFFPSWFMRPWVVLWEHEGTKIFCYPIAPAAEEGRFTGRGRTRLQGARRRGPAEALRRLSEGPMKLSEAAAELSIAQSTAQHHPRDPPPRRVRDDSRRGRERLQPPHRPAPDRRPAHRLPRRLQVLGHDRVEHAVDPAVAAAVRLPLDALANEARPLRVPLRPLVEAVDLELDPVEAALVDQVPLEESRRIVGEPAAAEARMDGEAADVDDRAAGGCGAPTPSHRPAHRRARRS